MNKLLFIALLLLTLASCSIAPMNTPRSASSLGEGKSDLTAGLTPFVHVGVARGLYENFDIGLALEVQLSPQVSIWGKYSFINNPEGHSVAFYGGFFGASDETKSKGYFLGPIYSFKKDWFEHFFIVKYNYVSWSAGQISLDDRQDSLFDEVSWESESLRYFQLTYGINFWLSNTFAINLSGNYFIYEESNSQNTNVIPGIEMTWKL